VFRSAEAEASAKQRHHRFGAHHEHNVFEAQHVDGVLEHIGQQRTGDDGIRLTMAEAALLELKAGRRSTAVRAALASFTRAT